MDIIFLLLLLFGLIFTNSDSINAQVKDCSPINNLSSNVKETELIISGRVLSLDSKIAITSVLKTLKGFELIGKLKKASQSNDYHLIMIDNVKEFSNCKDALKTNQDFILFLKPLKNINNFKIIYFASYSNGNLETKITKLLSGSFSALVQANDPCSKLNCQFGASCKIWPGTIPKGVCHCPNIFCLSENENSKICGSDGNFYESECHLTRKQCQTQKSIKVSPMKLCDTSLIKDKNKPVVNHIQQDSSANQQSAASNGLVNSCRSQNCPPYATCEAYPYPHCKCPQDNCLSNSPFICGTDEITYTNLCEMKKVSCKANRLIKQQYQGKCDMCKFVKCDYHSQCQMTNDGLGTECVCADEQNACTRHASQVQICASNQQTYPSECHMNIASCRLQQQLFVVHKGSCKSAAPAPAPPVVKKTQQKDCDDKACMHGAKCIKIQRTNSNAPTTQCSCAHIQCANQWPDTVCADDGDTYSNQCFMRRSACEKQRPISVIYQGHCQQNPCARVKCSNPHQYCRVDINGRGVCVCPESCPSIVQPVCGSNHNNYDSVCHLIMQSCRTQNPIHVLHNGICSEEPRCQEQGYKCQANEICRSDLRQTKCECPTCPDVAIGEHVCGTDSKTYRSECHLRRHTCLNKDTATKMAHTGACDACRQKRCSYYAICKMNRFGEPQCICPTDCVYHPQVRNPVCGSDGRTYENECFLKVKSCAEARQIDIVSKQPCKKCPNNCPLGQMCRNGDCVCADKCSKLQLKVCGSDGSYYNNECELKRQACLQKTTIHIDFSEASCISRQYIADSSALNQQTNKQWINSPICYCNKTGSVDTFCDQYSSKCSCKPGVDGKLCDKCALGYWQFSENGCIACSCSKFGAESIQCDEKTGMCKCKPKAMGKYCSVCPEGNKMSNDGCKEISTNPNNLDFEELGFSSESFATSFWTGNADKYLLINVTVLPFNENGIIFYVSNPTRSADYLTLVINKGLLELRFDLGSGQLLIKSPAKLEIGKSHTIILERYERYARLTLDDRSNQYGSAPGLMTALDSGSLFTIGRPQLKIELQHTGQVSEGFIGCLKSLTIKAGQEVTYYKMNEQSKWVIESSNVKPNCPHHDYLNSNKQEQHQPIAPKITSSSNENTGQCGGSETNPCKNEGTCQEVSRNMYTCSCTPGYQGFHCEQYVAPIWKFQQNSFVIFPTEFLQLRKRINLEMQFLPTSANGLLAFISDGHDQNPAFITVQLVNNYVHVLCRTPIGVTKLVSDRPVIIGKWNKIVVLKATKYVYLSLNETPNPDKKRLIPKGFTDIPSYLRRKLTQFRITNQPIYFGGVDQRVYTSFSSIVNLKPNFQGAIQKITVNGEKLSLLSEDVLHQNISQWQGAPCGPLHNPCSKNNPMKSYCIPDMDKTLCFCNPQQEHLCLKDSMQHDNPIVTNNFNRRFNKDTIAKYTSVKNIRLKSSEKNNIRFTFKTQSKDGAILLMKKGHSIKKHFFIVSIRNGMIEVAINLGGTNGIIRVTSNRQIADNKWHTIQVIRNQRNVVLLVDNRMFRAQMLEDLSHTTLLTDGWLWLGGSRKPIEGFPWEYNTRFEGCISELYVNEVAYNLVSDARKNFGAVLKC